MSIIKVYRNGETRQFGLKVWEQLPADKYGWAPMAETPEEVKAIQVQAVTENPGKGEQGNSDLPTVIETPMAETPEEVKDTLEEPLQKSKHKKNAQADK